MLKTFNEVYVPRFSGVGEDNVATWLRTGEGPQFYLPDSLLTTRGSSSLREPIKLTSDVRQRKSKL